MRINKKVIILLAVLLAIGIIMLVPYFKGKKTGEFSVTPHPAQKLEEAIKAGKPVFVEFYSPG